MKPISTHHEEEEEEHRARKQQIENTEDSSLCMSYLRRPATTGDSSMHEPLEDVFGKLPKTSSRGSAQKRSLSAYKV